ncbi:hypothetical protein T484DRAFT_1819696 [Baffinella frigidus]|nr:hypothetical protein T484DRAFT_1819696 [Cryptophyta sp. CCMP2293]
MSGEGDGPASGAEANDPGEEDGPGSGAATVPEGEDAPGGVEGAMGEQRRALWRALRDSRVLEQRKAFNFGIESVAGAAR